jgi:hypothetical protein
MLEVAILEEDRNTELPVHQHVEDKPSQMVERRYV